MKKSVLIALIILFSKNIWSLDYINITYKSLYPNGDNTNSETVRIEFDNDGYLKYYKSITYYGTKRETEKTIIGKMVQNKYELDFEVKNAYYMNPADFTHKIIFEKTNDGWKEFKNDKFLAETKKSPKKTKMINLYKKDNKMECLYKMTGNDVSLYGDDFELINGFYVKKNLDKENYERVNFKRTDNNCFHIDYRYDCLHYVYDIETNYRCKNNDMIELLYRLKGIYINEIILPFIVLKTDIQYFASSFLQEGNILYNPEHLQQKDGLPWASANGRGIGEEIDIKEFEHKNPKEMVIMNGFQDKSHPDYYEKNSRVKTLEITNSQSKKSKTVIVKDIRAEQRFSLEDLGGGNEYSFEILDVYSGNKYDDLCIQYLVLE